MGHGARGTTTALARELAHRAASPEVGNVVTNRESIELFVSFLLAHCITKSSYFTHIHIFQLWPSWGARGATWLGGCHSSPSSLLTPRHPIGARAHGTCHGHVARGSTTLPRIAPAI